MNGAALVCGVKGCERPYFGSGYCAKHFWTERSRKRLKEVGIPVAPTSGGDNFEFVTWGGFQDLKLWRRP